MPTATIPLIPAAIWLSIDCSKAATSIPPSRNGVTKAVNVPRNMFVNCRGGMPGCHVYGIRDISDYVSFEIRVLDSARNDNGTLNLDRSFEHKVRGPGQSNVVELRTRFLKADAQLISSMRKNADRTAHVLGRGEN